MLKRTAGIAVASVVLLAGCTDTSQKAGNSESAESLAGAQVYGRYAALGDSFTAAPYVPVTDLAEGCLRSDGNYPSQVAQRLEIRELVDVSCSGAKTRDLRRPQETYRDVTVPAQLRAVTAQTDLVTVGVGGNDFGLFARVLRTCTLLRAQDPTGSPCAAQLAREGIDVGVQVRRVGDRLRKVLAQVQDRAPRAKVLLVGYPRISPEEGTCPRLLPLAEGDYRTASRVGASLNRAMKRSAEAAGVDFVDMYPASRGHDVCSARPWVNGRFTDSRKALAFHPLPAGQRAVADRIVRMLQ